MSFSGCWAPFLGGQMASCPYRERCCLLRSMSPSVAHKRTQIMSASPPLSGYSRHQMYRYADIRRGSWSIWLLSDSLRCVPKVLQGYQQQNQMPTNDLAESRHDGYHRTSSNPLFGRHETGSEIQRSMSDSCQPVPLVLILICGGNVPSAILR
jgi:hypothetical protein